MMKHYWQILSAFMVIVIAGVLQAQTNLLPNGDLETREPNFWTKLNDGMGGALCTWASDTAVASSEYSFKVVKPSATAEAVGWQSVNNAKLYWNNAVSGSYSLSFSSKTEGVNTNPANDDARIGVLYKFYSGGSPLAEQFVAVDQTAASSNWTDNSGVALVSGEPDEVVVELIMGKDATGTVWFDNIGCGTDPWSMGVFNGDAETPVGWMNWTDGEKIGYANVVGDTAHESLHSVLLEEKDDLDDEMVFYSEPVPAVAKKWYMISVWMKTEGINTDTSWFATNVTPDFDPERAGICFFFHKDPIGTNWDLVGGDQFFYVDQRVGKENEDWRQYVVVAQAPDEAAGFSMRARFNNLPMGKIWYDDFSAQEVTPVITALEEPASEMMIAPTDYVLKNNYPNPFNPVTIIEYIVPENGKVHLAIYNVLGQKVRVLVDKHQMNGTHRVMWDGTDDAGNLLPSGTYFYQLRGENALITKRMTFIK